jgi:hypothetical protein
LWLLIVAAAVWSSSSSSSAAAAAIVCTSTVIDGKALNESHNFGTRGKIDITCCLDSNNIYHVKQHLTISFVSFTTNRREIFKCICCQGVDTGKFLFTNSLHCCGCSFVHVAVVKLSSRLEDRKSTEKERVLVTRVSVRCTALNTNFCTRHVWRSRCKCLHRTSKLR